MNPTHTHTYIYIYIYIQHYKFVYIVLYVNFIYHFNYVEINSTRKELAKYLTFAQTKKTG